MKDLRWSSGGAGQPSASTIPWAKKEAGATENQKKEGKGSKKKDKTNGDKKKSGTTGKGKGKGKKKWFTEDKKSRKPSPRSDFLHVYQSNQIEGDAMLI